jgi:hypothetical protein
MRIDDMAYTPKQQLNEAVVPPNVQILASKLLANKGVITHTYEINAVLQLLAMYLLTTPTHIGYDPAITSSYLMSKTIASLEPEKLADLVSYCLLRVSEMVEFSASQATIDATKLAQTQLFNV